MQGICTVNRCRFSYENLHSHKQISGLLW